MADWAARVDRLEEENARLRAERTEMSQNYIRASEELVEARTELAVVHNQGTATIEHLSGEVDRLRGELVEEREHVADLEREILDCKVLEYQDTIARVHSVADAIDTEMRTEPDTQRAAMQMEAVVRFRAALEGEQ